MSLLPGIQGPTDHAANVDVVTASGRQPQSATSVTDVMTSLVESEGNQRLAFDLPSGSYYVRFNAITGSFEAFKKCAPDGTDLLIDANVQFDNSMTIPGFMEIRGDIEELNFGEALYIGSNNPNSDFTEARAIIAPHNLTSFGYARGALTKSSWRPTVLLGMRVQETPLIEQDADFFSEAAFVDGNLVSSSAGKYEQLAWDHSSQTMTLHLGWSDQSQLGVQGKLEAAGLTPDQFCLFTNDAGKGDVGFGFVVIENEAQLAAILDYASKGSTGNKTFVNQVVLNIANLTLSDFAVQAEKGDYGKSANRDQDIQLSGDGYTVASVVTDDPSQARAVSPKTSFVGLSQFDDGMFTVTDGDMAVNMYGSGGRDFLVGTVTLIKPQEG